jgi:reverse transcriptase-like protein
MIIITVVDDMLIFSTTIKSMQNAKHDISDAFEVTDLGEPSKIVGIEIAQDRENKKITVTQTGYIETILTKLVSEGRRARHAAYTSSLFFGFNFQVVM